MNNKKHQYYAKKRIGLIERLRAWMNIPGAKIIIPAKEKTDPFRDIKGLQ